MPLVLQVDDEVVVPRSSYAEVFEVLKRAFAAVLKESGAWGGVPIKVNAQGEESVS